MEISPVEAAALGAQKLTHFGRLFLPKTFRQQSPEFHDEMGGLLYDRRRFNEFLCFRGSAKTTLLRAFTLQRIAYAISRTVMYTSASQGHAIHSIRWVKRQIEQNQRLGVFRLRPGGKWTDEWIEVVNEVEGVAINVFAVGITGQTRGFNLDDYRPDLIIGDDVLDDENTATKEQRAKVEDRWFGALVNSLAPESEAPWAKCVLAQTPFNAHDLSMKCAKDPEYGVKVYGCFDEAGESRWLARWTTEQLRKAKEAATLRGTYRIWMREMECKVVTDESKALDVGKFQYWDKRPEGLPGGMTKVVSVDPASAESKKANQHVTLCLGQKGLDFFVCAYRAAKAHMPDKAASDFFEIVLNNSPIQCATVETNGYQRTLKWHFEQEMAKRRLWVPIQQIETKTRKADKIITAIAGVLHYGHLWIHASMQELVEQADMYNPEDPDAEDDILDALAMAIIKLNPSLAYATPMDIEGEYMVVEDEREYDEVTIGGCP